MYVQGENYNTYSFQDIFFIIVIFLLNRYLIFDIDRELTRTSKHVALRARCGYSRGSEAERQSSQLLKRLWSWRRCAVLVRKKLDGN